MRKQLSEQQSRRAELKALIAAERKAALSGRGSYNRGALMLRIRDAYRERFAAEFDDWVLVAIGAELDQQMHAANRSDRVQIDMFGGATVEMDPEYAVPAGDGEDEADLRVAHDRISVEQYERHLAMVLDQERALSARNLEKARVGRMIRETGAARHELVVDVLRRLRPH